MPLFPRTWSLLGTLFCSQGRDSLLKTPIALSRSWFRPWGSLPLEVPFLSSRVPLPSRSHYRPQERPSPRDPLSILKAPFLLRPRLSSFPFSKVLSTSTWTYIPWHNKGKLPQRRFDTRNQWWSWGGKGGLEATLPLHIFIVFLIKNIDFIYILPTV